mgnify:CR=1 FL=1
MQENLLLASASPRRSEILSTLGFEFEILPADVDEDEIIWNDPSDGAMLLAELKAVASQVHRPRKTVIGADTIVLCGGRRMGKPGDEEEAAGMLEELSGGKHQVITGVALLYPPNTRILEVESTDVYFRELERSEISRYVMTGEPMDKAGAYAIQGHAGVFVERIEGCFFNVVGLPVPRLFAMFRSLERSIGRDEGA